MARLIMATAASAKTGTVLPAETNGQVGDGNYANNSGRTIIIARNASVDTNYDVTVHVRKEVEGKNVEEHVKEVAFGTTQVFGPYPVSEYGTEIWVNVEHADIKLRAIQVSGTG